MTATTSHLRISEIPYRVLRCVTVIITCFVITPRLRMTGCLHSFWTSLTQAGLNLNVTGPCEGKGNRARRDPSHNTTGQLSHKAAEVLSAQPLHFRLSDSVLSMLNSFGTKATGTTYIYILFKQPDTSVRGKVLKVGLRCDPRYEKIVSFIASSLSHTFSSEIPGASSLDGRSVPNTGAYIC